jgi:polar amino acid transport system substrate-binding protein
MGGPGVNHRARLNPRRSLLRASCAPVAVLLMTAALATGGWSSGTAGAKERSGSTPAKLVTSTARHHSSIVAITTPYPPAEFLEKNGKTYTGWEIELTNTIMHMLHLKVTYMTATNTDDIPSVQSGRAQISPGSWTITSKREKIVQFVPDFNAGTQFFVSKSSSLTINSKTGLCGLSLAVLAATIEATAAETQTKKCTAAGKPKIDIQDYPTEAAVTLAIESGRAQVGWTGSPQAEYLVEQQPTKFKLGGKDFTVAPLGIIVSKHLPGLAKAMAAAINDLIKNGKYGSILKHWGVSSGGIHHSVVKK